MKERERGREIRNACFIFALWQLLEGSKNTFTERELVNMCNVYGERISESFTERELVNLLQKRPVILRSLLIVATQYHVLAMCIIMPLLHICWTNLRIYRALLQICRTFLRINKLLHNTWGGYD